MKTKTMKRLAAAVAAITMMSAVPMMNVLADDPAPTYTVTITGDQNTNRNYVAYKIFNGEYGSNGKLSNISWNDSVINSSAFIGELKTSSVLKTDNNFDFSKTDISIDDVVNILSGYNTTPVQSEKIEEFARIAKKHLQNGVTGTALSNNSTLEAGYYLILESDNDSVATAISRGMLKVVEDISIAPKIDYPTIDKTVKTGTGANDWGVANTKSIGDLVEYKLETKVPDMTGYNQYLFVVNDKLSSGLELNTAADSFSVYIEHEGDNGQKSQVTLTENKVAPGKYSADNGYYIEAIDANYTKSDGSTGTYKNAFRLVFNNMKGLQEHAGEKIIITYSAYLGGQNGEIKDAVSYETTGTTANLNKANIFYSSDPNAEYTGTPKKDPNDATPPINSDPSNQKPYEPPIKENPTKSTPDDPTDDTPGTPNNSENPNNPGKPGTPGQPSKTSNEDEVYTYTAALQVHKTDGSGTPLADAVFNLSDSSNNVIGTVTSSAAGLVEFKGLGAGTYKLEETQAPAGYNKDNTVYTLEISADTSAENNAKCTWTVGNESTKNGNNDVFTVTANTSTYNVTIINQAGATLPSTGGIGTTIFYVSGGALILGAGVVLITKKRMSAKEDR